ncbi:transcriptional regulator Rrf2 family protein [Listeria floridensis FSL S10-1187]|uniref:Transcriptional regulator Rrf2 family protein n=1 Tax=Listeria floridensis FSL S10-1187 TaxID=1265817 RepID=A0ABP3AX91_9LIST|nr:Rrf2 family transcriptional regulator [Listeria floridensis]EUJ27436.1 transcriptional regulator Rrf2 family protein [Listeria floridensis FSL S10-1187]
MAISTRFSVAVHILVLIDSERSKQITSDHIAASVGTNPVVIRRIMSLLKKAGILHSSPGLSATYLTRSPAEISLYQIYTAVEGSKQLFDMHKNPNPNCFVGANIQAALDETFIAAQSKMEAELKDVSLEDIIHNMPSKTNL